MDTSLQFTLSVNIRTCEKKCLIFMDIMKNFWITYHLLSFWILTNNWAEMLQMKYGHITLQMYQFY